MTRIKRFWFDLTTPSEWFIVMWVNRIMWKLKDYDRIEYDYSCVLDHATNARMSKTNYTLTAIYSEIDDAKSKEYYSVVRDDIFAMMKGGAKNDEIKEYLNQLT